MLNLIRWKNLCMIALVQFLIKYALLEPFGVETTLDFFGISLLALATICIAAAGNVINDIYDIETDFVNKPDRIIVGKTISEKAAYNLFIALNLIGVSLGFYLSHLVDKAPFFTIFVLISALLYVYATTLKQTLLIGNLVISILVASSILIVGVFDLLPEMSPENRATQLTFFKVIWDYAVFAFMINLLREIAKDLEDIDGDYNAGMNTLPIALGRERTKNILIALNFVPLVAIIYYVTSVLYKQQIAVIYFLIFVLAPLIYILIKTFSASAKKDFHHLSNIYKLVMLFGMLSLLLYKFVILN
ncbi:geranylgeranylglycerol-phosphate geranylgeranyltransferase [Tamlana sp. 2_MG-2023]|nr:MULTISPECIES: geranylgeranylglycerol-phosphate geranylgeranyltransferase [unclassified Tamlana]MDO6759192.1 geranylgeranylglycerol-phosphate geranylgeranyltransferase [Tamlana sp. 2_MG-2023]MDO6790669.1 geranylgeranylglycerol-phosphate geranylgeranyltransferase [Tamlana sp. 1_MG-2023]